MKTKHLRVALSTSWLVAVIVAVAFVLSSCAGMGINLDTPKKRYLAARSELNLLLEQYIKIQNNEVLKVSDERHERIKLAFISADVALDSWELAVLAGISDYDWAKDMQTWLDAKNIIMNILMEVD